METALQRQPFLDDGHQDVDGHRNPDLSFDGILAISVKGLDPQVLLDPLEEEFHLPARLVEQADGEGRQVEIVGEEAKKTILFGIVKVNPAEWVRVMLPGGGGSQDNGVIRSKSGRGVNVARVAPTELDAFLGASDEESASFMEDLKST